MNVWMKHLEFLVIYFLLFNGLGGGTSYKINLLGFDLVFGTHSGESRGTFWAFILIANFK